MICRQCPHICYIFDHTKSIVAEYRKALEYTNKKATDLQAALDVMIMSDNLKDNVIKDYNTMHDAIHNVVAHALNEKRKNSGGKL